MKPRVHKYANGGKVTAKKKPMKPHIPPRVKDPISSENPGGPDTPGAKGTYPMPKPRKKK
jgi:hypothetical protein